MSAAVKVLDGKFDGEEVRNGSDQSAAVLEALYQAQPVVEYRMDGTILMANAIFSKFTGYESSELRGRTYSVFCDSNYAHGPEGQKLWEKLTRGESDSREFKIFGKNGKELWTLATFAPVLGGDGSPCKVVQTFGDISEVKSELNVRSEIMNLTSIVSEGNLRGDILSLNDKFVEVSKYSREELIGKPHNTTRHPDMPKDVFKQMWATISSGKIFRGVVKNRAKDGTPYYVDAVIAPILGENGKPKKYLGVRYDITETEIERQNMRGVLRAIDASFAYTEFDTNGVFTNCNRIFQTFMECGEHDIKGKHHRMFCDPAFSSSMDYVNFWADLKAGRPQSGVYRQVSRSGKELWLQAVYSPVTDETGRVYKIVGIATDVTEQQKMIASIEETANTLAGASAELTATATEMADTASRTSKESLSASSASDQVSAGVQTVAANVEEMVASIKEIGLSTNESAQMAKMTLAKAQESNSIITKLGVSSMEIGNVVKVINSIAQQTNLLALNATIEAARAGEAGKGFAVVANEVKELAKQTSKATDDIASKIGAIQQDTKGAIDAITGISSSVDKLSGLSSVVATAVEEQTATTNEISRVVAESRKGVESISETIKVVSMAANASSASSSQMLGASRELSHLAERLSALVKRVKKI